MTEKKTKASSAKRPAGKPSIGFSAEEKAAMKEYAKELKAAKAGADGEKMLLDAIAKMPPADRALGKKLHAIVKANAPELTSRTWYGMPAWVKDDKVLCFFQAASKFKARYATLGFSGEANLDKGNMWPTSFAVTKLTGDDEAKIAALIKKAVRA